MKLFTCANCGNLLHFENTACARCGATLGYDPTTNTLPALEADGQGAYRTIGRKADGRSLRFCDNAGHGVCNWLLEDGAPGSLCLSCRHNRTIPDLSVPQNVSLWARLEQAKRRTLYTFYRLGLPVPDRQEDPEGGLAFDFLADLPSEPNVMTGHDNGLITLALAEADDAERERRRVGMGEPYRTLLGHFRHETGHYYWDRLVRDGGRLDECRAVFGDDTADYGQALQRHYDSGPPADWQQHYVSAYATAHPWEDFAETWAHYLHLVDTLEMARSLGLDIAPHADKSGELTTGIEISPWTDQPIERLIEAWVPLTVAVNSLNRCLGEGDAYPFVLSADAIGKLGFIHSILHDPSGKARH